MRCGSRTCAEDRGKDFRRLLEGYSGAVGRMRAPKLVTLTLVNKPELSREEVDRLRACWKRLMHRKRYRERIRGGLYSIEAINKGRGWHVHMHVLLDADYLDQAQLSADWRKLTGDSYVVDVRKAWTPRAGLKYILKYLTKAPETDGQDWTYTQVLKRIRLVQPFGSLYRQLVLEKPPALVCPACGGMTWISLEWEPGWRGS